MKKSVVIKFPLKANPPRAPGGLGKHGRRLWRGIQEQYCIDDPGGLSHLFSAARSEDAIMRLRGIVTLEGDTVADRFGQKKAHPLLPEIRGLESVKRAALMSLNLDLEPLNARPGRPSGR